MTKWRQYIDDSATHGSVLDKKFRPIPTKENGVLPVTAAGSIIVDTTAEAEILKDLDELRHKIKGNIGVDYLPDIHMRLMWGKSVPKTNKGVPNPYLNSTLLERFRWSREALAIIAKYSAQGSLYIASGSIEVEDCQKWLNTVNLNPDFIMERNIIESKFGKVINEYYKVIFNPLIEEIINLMITADMFASRNHASIEVFYDTTEASKGFSASELYRTVKPHGYFTSIESIVESNAHNHSLIQLADVISFTKNRLALEKYRKKNYVKWSPDYALHALMQGLADTIQDANYRVNFADNFRYYIRPKAIIIALYFVDFLVKKDENWVAQYMVNFEEASELLSDTTSDSKEATTAIHRLIKTDILDEYKNGKRQL